MHGPKARRAGGTGMVSTGTVRAARAASVVRAVMVRVARAASMVSAASVAVGLVAGAASPLAAQTPADDSTTAVVRGVVLDALTGARLDGARVRISDLRRGTLTDSAGAFVFDEVPIGGQLLTIEHYGFEGVDVSMRVFEHTPPLQIELNPKPVMLEGLPVVTERLTRMESRLRTRRRATATSVRAVDLERLTRSPARDMVELLQFEAFVTLSPCSGRMMSSFCILRRGRWTQPAVYIDEAPAIGGLDQLATYRPSDLYLVEVYSGGLQIRAYTHGFMERMARRPMALIPIMW